MKNLWILAIGLIAPTFAAFAEKHDLGDAQVVNIVVAVNNNAIEAGELARSRSSNEKVKAFAHGMVGEHADVNKSITELVTRLDLTPHDSPIAKDLKAEGEKDRAALKALTGEEFDKAYVDKTITLHQNVLDMIDNQLMPKVENQELKALLFSLFSPFSDHLRDAQQIRASLKEH